MEYVPGQSQPFVEDTEVATEAATERETQRSSFAQGHLCVLVLLSSLQLLWSCLTSEMDSVLAQSTLVLFLGLVPLLCTAKVGRLPPSVAASYPLLCNGLYVYLALNRPPETLHIHALAGYVQHVVCVIEYSITPVQAYPSLVIHFLSWAGVIFYLQGSLGGACEAVSFIGVVLVTFLCVAQRLRCQSQLLTQCLSLEQKQSNIQNLLHKMSENIAVLSQDYMVLMKNRGFAMTFLGDEFSVVASKIAVSHQSDRTMLQEFEEFIYQNKETTNFRAIKNQVVYSCSLYKVHWAQEECVAFVSQDITQSIRLERTCSKNKGVSATLRSVTHEIKTPVNYLLHSLGSIRETEPLLSEWASTTLCKAQLVAEYLLCCVSEIVDYSNAKAKRLFVAHSSCSLAAVFAEVEAILTALCSDSQLVSVSFRTLSSSYVLLDYLKFKQVLLNVASNCLRYENSIVIQGTLSDGELAVFVTALGVHIDLNVLEDPDQGSVNEGVAIRLELIKDTLAALGGTQLSFSQSEEGTVIHFTLSVEEDCGDSDYSVPDEEVNLWGQTRELEIMVVDDNALGLQILEEKLRAAGLRCETAINGQDCIDKLRQLDIQGVHLKAIILDIQMPVLDGWQCAVQINRLYEAGELTQLPYILAYSAFSTEEDIEKCIACGMNDILSKPAPNSDLFSKLSTILKRTLSF